MRYETHSDCWDHSGYWKRVYLAIYYVVVEATKSALQLTRINRHTRRSLYPC